MARMEYRCACCLAIIFAILHAAIVERRCRGEDVALRSIYSETHRLEEFVSEDTKAIVVAFLDVNCPVAKNYLPRLGDLSQQYRDSGVVTLGVFSDPRADARSIAIFAHDHDIAFPVLLDIDHRLADRFDVQVTPEVLLLDRNLERRYQGPIDNQFKRAGSLPAPTEKYLEDALTATLAGKDVEPARRPASGCPLARQEPLQQRVESLYHRDVEPIIQRRCQSCHRAGGVGPFELMNYEDAYYNADRIAEVVRDRQMPPWHGYLNQDFGELLNDQRLTDDELNILLGWIEQGAPEGDAYDAPPAKEWPAPNAWQIGKPDFIYKMPRPFKVPKQGVLEYQFFRVPLNLPEDRWYRAVEVKPGKAEVVHHVAVHVVPAGDKRYQGLTAMAELYGFNTQRGNVIADYVPGDTHNAKTFDAGQAARIPKHSDLMFEVHYTPNNRAEVTDQSMIGFRWAAEPPAREVHGRVFRKPVGRFRIPPHDPHYRMEDSYYFPEDVDLDAVRPHFHLRGKSYRLELVERDEATGEITQRETILSVPLYNQQWQRMYEFTKPIRIPAGTELLATAHFDNSRLNPYNPDPAVEVHWGQQTTDEMFSTRFRYRMVEESTP